MVRLKVRRHGVVGMLETDINKGDLTNLVDRSRFVAKEIKCNYGGDHRSQRPRLGRRSKILISNFATNPMDNRKLMFTDVSKAYLSAPVVQSNIFTDLFLEVHQQSYGTRAAAQAWEKKYTNTLIEFGFTVGSSSACCFGHKSHTWIWSFTETTSRCQATVTI